MPHHVRKYNYYLFVCIEVKTILMFRGMLVYLSCTGTNSHTPNPATLPLSPLIPNGPERALQTGPGLLLFAVGGARFSPSSYLRLPDLLT